MEVMQSKKMFKVFSRGSLLFYFALLFSQTGFSSVSGASITFCECVSDASGSHLILVAVSETNGQERWRRILDTIPVGAGSNAACKEKLSLANYCVR